MKFDKILVANRGEIALRIISTCREMGIKTVTIYTKEELGLPHMLEGDEPVCIGQGSLKDTYLNRKKIIEIAKHHGANAIHPGYGFLSENAEFAREVSAEGLKFIGPAPIAIELMGDKQASKKKMEQIGIPLIKGFHGDEQGEEFLKNKAAEIGFPILIKASAGGGGKGMRVVHSIDGFLENLEGAKREALNAFGNDKVLLENYIKNPRHIEVQVLGDQHGNYFHLFERECSIQRRHQKIIEETPSTALTPELRNKITNNAVKICESIGYEGAGTVEFLLDEDGKYYFLEMNTRLQVEHPITEMITGLDLVRLQIQIAQGEAIPFKQEDIKQQGHALELRIYAEDPDNEFLPSTGVVEYLGESHLHGVRLDTGYISGSPVSINFDPMLAKLVVHGSNREHSITKAKLAIDEFPFFGVKTNREYLKRILKTKAFQDGNTTTSFINTFADELLPKELDENTMATAIASFLFASKKNNSKVKLLDATQSALTSPWQGLNNFRNSDL